MIKKGLANKYSKITDKNTSRLVNLEKINNTFSHKNKQQSAYTSITTITNNIEKVQRKIQINDEILFRRKQNYLNTHYNKRLNALKQITKENKKIYERINSQKSLYSQQDMRRSSISIRSLSKSSSRISNRSGVSQNKITQTNRPKLLKNHVALTIQPQSLTNVKGDQVKQFKSVFMIQHKPSNKNQRLLNSSKKNNRSFSVKIQAVSNKVNPNMGNMLHKIAQQMYQKPIKKLSYNKRRFIY